MTKNQPNVESQNPLSPYYLHPGENPSMIRNLIANITTRGRGQ